MWLSLLHVHMATLRAHSQKPDVSSGRHEESSFLQAAASTIYNAAKAFTSFRQALRHVKKAVASGRSLLAIVASVLF